MRRSPGRSAAATSTTGRCVASAAGCGRAWVKRHRTQDGPPWVRSCIVILFAWPLGEYPQRRPPGLAGGASITTVTADAFVVDITPEVAVVLGVGDADFLARLID